MSTSPRPPGLATWLLRKIYDEDLFEDVAGDLQEMYTERLHKQGRGRASLHYFKDVLLSLRNLDLKREKRRAKKKGWILAKSNFKMTFRNLGRNRVYSGMNILGLALGMAAFLFILQYVTYERSYDSFHSNRRNLYRVTYQQYSAGALVKEFAVTAPRVAPYMKENLPEVKSFARVHPFDGLVYSYDNKKFREDGTKIVDPEFLDLFTFPLVEGDPKTALTKVNSLVVTERIAKKYFGDQSPIGKVMDIDGYKDYVVTGVAKNPPVNSHIKFDFLLSYATLHFWRGDDVETSWWWLDFHSYVLLEPGTDPVAFERKFAQVLEKDGRKKLDFNSGLTEKFPLQPVTSIHLYSHLLLELQQDEQGDSDAVFFLTIIAFFILLMAWVNYVNLSTARSIERAKEVGVRKSIGAFRGQLINQFLVESMIMNFIALAIGLTIVVAGIHYFNGLTDSRLDLNFLSDPIFWMRVASVFLVGSFLSGMYPAFVLSSFQPLAVLKGKLGAHQPGVGLRRVLVVFQFAASVTLITGTTIVYLQLRYMRTTDLGFDMTRTVVIRGPNPVNDEEDGTEFKLHSATFKNELLRDPAVKTVTSSTNVPGIEIEDWRGIKKPGGPESSTVQAHTIWVDDHYLSTYRIELLGGRSFGPEFTPDSTSVILNVAAIKALGFRSPADAIDQEIVFDGKVSTITGVVRDYNQLSVKNPVTPLAFRREPGAYYYYTVKLDGNDYPSTLSLLQKKYETFYPKAPFDYFFLDDFYERQYDNDRKFSNVFSLFAGFAIFVACLGLFGLSSFSALQRTKEIGIRKVLGANVPNIVFLLSREFISLVLIGMVLAWPVIYLVMNSWLSHFAKRIQPGLPVFLLSGLAVVAIALITVGYKTLLTARSNPVHALKCE